MTPKELQKHEVRELAFRTFCNYDYDKTDAWCEAPSPLINNMSPYGLIEAGHGEELIAVMKQELIKVDA